MTAYPLAHLIKMPAKPYVHSTATDIRKTFDDARRQQAERVKLPGGRTVAVLKKRGG